MNGNWVFLLWFFASFSLDLGRYWLHKCRSMTFRSFFSPTLSPRFNDFFTRLSTSTNGIICVGMTTIEQPKTTTVMAKVGWLRRWPMVIVAKSSLESLTTGLLIHPLSTCFKVAPRAINLVRSIVLSHKHYSKQLIQNHLKFNHQPSTEVS